MESVESGNKRREAFLEVGEETKRIFRDMCVKLSWAKGDEFRIPMGITNYYSLRTGDALYCELISLENETREEIEEIGEDILVDIVKESSDILYGRIPEPIFDSYTYMCKNGYARLRIKGVVRKFHSLRG
jgi:hypothetical protein